MQKKIATFGLLAMIVSVPAIAEDFSVKLATQVCSSCHGADGNSINPVFPRLAAQQKDYLVNQLKNLKAQTRTDKDAHDYMWGLTRSLDDKTIEGLAVYYSSQKPVPGEVTDPRLMEQGKAIFEKGIKERDVPPCATCHGANAEGMGMFPRLAGQHRQYIIRQIQVFHTNQRPNWEIMQPIVKTLTEKEMEALATYLRSK